MVSLAQQKTRLIYGTQLFTMESLILAQDER